MDPFDLTQDYNYSYEETNETGTEETFLLHKPQACSSQPWCVSLLVIIALIFVVGFCGNALVIWIAGFKMRKTVNTTWYLSLAVSDLVFCALLPFNIAYMAMGDWVFGRVMCKLVPSVLFLNMFSSIFVLVIISVDRLVSVAFPVWAQNHRTVQKASAVVFLAWLLSIALSLPSAVFRDVSSPQGQVICHNAYMERHNHVAVVLSRLLAGFVVPIAVIIVCYSVIIVKLRNNRMTKTSKPFKVMSALVAAFFVCWLPYHVFVVLELNHESLDRDLLTAGLKVGTVTATANSFLNPLLYVFMGNDFRQKFRSSMLSKMENGMAEDGRTSTSRYLSRSSTVDRRASTNI